MKKGTTYVLLGLIFLFTLSLRLYFAFQTESFTGGESYFSLRQAKEIVETGTPIFEDPLSFGGRIQLFTPLFYYILAFFNLFMPLHLVGKIVPNLLASLAVIPIFLISRDLTGSGKIALFTSFVSTFIPIFFSETFNSVTAYSAVVPLVLFLLHSFLRLNRKMKYQVTFVVLLLITLFIHPVSTIFILGLVIFIFLMKLERMRVQTAEIELTVFSAFFALWLYLVIFKKAFLLYGPSIIFQNIPSTLLTEYFAEVDVLTMVSLIGVIPFLYAVYIIYKFLFKQKSRSIFVILSFVLASALLLWFRLISFRSGLVFLGIFMLLLMSVYLKHFFGYLSKTRFSRFENLFVASLLIGFITTSFIPTLRYAGETLDASFTKDEVSAFEWMGRSLPPEAVILASPEEGHLITGISGRKNVLDTRYLFIKDIDMLFDDVDYIYTTLYETQAINLLSKYGVTHIYTSPRVLEQYGTGWPGYLDDTGCFKEVYASGEVRVFQSLCELTQ